MLEAKDKFFEVSENQSVRDIVLGVSEPNAGIIVEDKLKAYASDGIHRVEGWLEPQFLSAIALIAHVQKQAGLKGSMGEIGVHHGKFYIPLAHAMGQNTKGVAIDIFENQHLNPDGSGKGNKEIFVQNLENEGLLADNHKQLTMDSKLLKADHILDALGGEQPLLFSIDGAHTTEYTFSDFDVVAQVLHDWGAIIIDDIFNPAWPGVIDGTLQWLRSAQGRNFQMVLYGNNKGIICKKPAAEVYGQMIAANPFEFMVYSKPLTFADSLAHYAKMRLMLT